MGVLKILKKSKQYFYSFVNSVYFLMAAWFKMTWISAIVLYYAQINAIYLDRTKR